MAKQLSTGDNELEVLKQNVEDSHTFFRENYKSYSQMRRFVFDSCFTPEEIALLRNMGRPQLEFNVLKAYVSRLCGEWSKQEPDIEVSAFDDRDIDAVSSKVISAHMKAVLSDEDNSHMVYGMYEDCLSGGFTVGKVFTDYRNSMSMEQNIYFRKGDPLLTGFDPKATEEHKGDGQFCFEFYPMDEESLKRDYPNLSLDGVHFSRNNAGFSYGYSRGKQKIALVCEYYEKRAKKKTLVRLTNGQTMLKADYNKLLLEWDSFEVPPEIVDSRKTSIECIVKHKFIQDKFLERDIETDFEYLPLVFISGSSKMIRDDGTGEVRQVTKAYVADAVDSQRMKNYAGIALMNEIENTTQAKLKVAKEALPKESPELMNAYTDPQNANVYVFNSVYEDNPDMPIPNPISEVAKVPAPPEIFQAFSGADSTIQQVLGSYDASLGINDNQLSGVAVVEAATQSNAAAMPFVVGVLHGLSRMAQIYVSLMPKYFVTPRTIPTIDDEGKRQYIKINQEGGYQVDFEVNAFNVLVKAGASFQVQKSKTINMVKEVMQMSPLFAQFMGEEGLKFILDNMDGAGIDELKELTKGWVEQYKQQQAQAQQAQAQQGNPMEMQLQAEMQAIQMQAESSREKHMIEMEALKLKAEVDREKMELDKAKMALEFEKLELEREKMEREAEAKIAEIVMRKEIAEENNEVKLIESDRKHALEVGKLHHERIRDIEGMQRTAEKEAHTVVEAIKDV